MERYSVEHRHAQAALLSQLERFTQACEKLSATQLLAASGCHGWAALDVVVHVRMGLDEMLRGFLARTEGEPTVDAASYWAGQAPAVTDADDDVAGIMFLRRTASAYGSPLSAVAHLRDAARTISDAVGSMSEGRVTFQGQVLSSGDFLASWAMELVLHQLDLVPGAHPSTVDADALALTRHTVEALAGAGWPAGWDDQEVALVATGRRPPAEDEVLALHAAGIRIPVLH